jgi:hypothetical protein
MSAPFSLSPMQVRVISEGWNQCRFEAMICTRASAPKEMWPEIYRAAEAKGLRTMRDGLIKLGCPESEVDNWMDTLLAAAWRQLDELILLDGEPEGHA